jgi:hypothetical protein
MLRNKDKESLLAIFAMLNIPVEVWAYGSRVSGKAHEGSDLVYSNLGMILNEPPAAYKDKNHDVKPGAGEGSA